MGRFAGMKGLVLGVANDHSLAWAIAKEILAGGRKTLNAAIGFVRRRPRPLPGAAATGKNRSSPR